MARLGPAAKMRRVLEFLIGLRDDRVIQALGEFGFTPADRDQGWDLLRGLGVTQAVPKSAAAANPALDALDTWRRQWLRIASVSLVQDFPRVYDQIFSGIADSRKPSFAVVPILADRLEKLERASDANSRVALAKLRRRGLTRECIAEARQFMTEIKVTQPVKLPDLDVRRAQIASAEAALWKYYVEWSQIARAAIKTPRLLELLGFRGGTDDEGDAPKAIAEAPALLAVPVTAVKRRTRRKLTGRKVAK